MRFNNYILQIAVFACVQIYAMPNSSNSPSCGQRLAEQALKQLEKSEPWKHWVSLSKEIRDKTRDPEALFRFSKRFSCIHNDHSRYLSMRLQQRLSFELETLDVSAAQKKLTEVFNLEGEGFRYLRESWEILENLAWKIQLQNTISNGKETPFSKNQYSIDREKKLISVKLGPDSVPWMVALAEAIFILSSETKLKNEQYKAYLEFREGKPSPSGRLFYYLVMSSAGDLTAYFYLSLTRTFYFQGCTQWEELTLQDDLINLRLIIRTHVVFFLLGKHLLKESELRSFDELGYPSLWDKEELPALWQFIK